MRSELGLPMDRPIIMAGHHPDFWHTGVLAKYLAADAASAALGAQSAWLFVDQDRSDSSSFRYPTLRSTTLGERSSLGMGAVTARAGRLPPTPDLPPSFAPRMDLLRSTFDRHSSAPDLSPQLASTLSDLIRPHLSLHHFTVFATEISRTSLFRSLVERMAREPEACISQYNAAAARHPTAGIRPLTTDDVQDRWELPLWHLPPGKPRSHVYAEDLASIPMHELAPKALLMTGLMRLAACDLFIHGLGAANNDRSHEGYDIITEEWLERWLGVPRIAPMTLVTATRYLPLASQSPPTAADVAKAQWTVHHARHHPDLLGDTSGSRERDRLLAAIQALPRRSGERGNAFTALHRLIDSARRSHPEGLDRLDANARDLRARFAERALIYDRTWPFALFPESVLADLCNQIRLQFQTA